MKTISTLLILFAATIFSLNAQDVVIDSPLDNFNEMNIRGSVNVHFSQGESSHIKCTLSEKAKDALTYEVDGSVLYLSTKKSPETIDVYISAPQLKKVDIGSAASFNSEGQIKGTAITFITSGAASMEADIAVESLDIIADGASDLKLSGSANKLKAKAQGATTLKAKDLVVEQADIIASGASDLDLNVSKSLKVYAEGASDVNFIGAPENVNIEIEGIANVNDKEAVGNILIKDGDTLSIGNREIIITEDDIDKDNSDFNGHWGGIDFAFNGFLSPANELNIAPGNSFMNLEFSRSWGLELNLIEQSFNLVRNHIGLVTGLGLHIQNYRLDNTVRLISDSATLMSWTDTMSNSIRSKMVSSYLILPLMLEYQTNNENEKNSFHIGVGGFVGTRLSSHTKVSIDNGNGKDKIKSYDNYHLNPLKYGLMARIGWGHLNLFANYSLSTMFADNEGPEVYPLEFGITIVGW